MRLEIYSAPASEPITVSDAKSFMRVEVTDDDTLIGYMITAARQYGEMLTERSWMTQTLDLYLDEFPDEISLVGPPVASVTHIKYYDSSDVQQTLSASEYQTSLGTDIARIKPAFGYVWPVTYDRYDAIVVRYVAGYASAAAVPEAMKSWLKVRVASMYENREGFVVGQTFTPATRDFVDGLLDPYRAPTKL